MSKSEGHPTELVNGSLHSPLQTVKVRGPESTTLATYELRRETVRHFSPVFFEKVSPSEHFSAIEGGFVQNQKHHVFLVLIF